MEKEFRYILSRVDVGQMTYKYHWTLYCLYEEVGPTQNDWE